MATPEMRCNPRAPAASAAHAEADGESGPELLWVLGLGFLGFLGCGFRV